MNLIKKIFIATFIFISCLFSLNTFAWFTGHGCVAYVSASDADHHTANKTLKIKLLDGPAKGKTVDMTLQQNKKFKDLKSGDLFYAHNTVHQVIKIDHVANGYNITSKNTGLVIHK